MTFDCHLSYVQCSIFSMVFPLLSVCDTVSLCTKIMFRASLFLSVRDQFAYFNTSLTVLRVMRLVVQYRISNILHVLMFNNYNNLYCIKYTTFFQSHAFIQEKVFVGVEGAPGFNVTERLKGPDNSYLTHISAHTGGKAFLRGRASGYIEPTSGTESFEALHIFIR